MQAYTLRCGLPHSEIHGSKGARPSPQLFAACHVLHRLLAPRHPPDALFNASFSSLYPCPENGPDVRDQVSGIRLIPSSEHQPSRIVIRAVSCIRPVQNSHEPKALSTPHDQPHWHTVDRSMRIQAPKRQNHIRDRRAPHNLKRSNRHSS